MGASPSSVNCLETTAFFGAFFFGPGPAMRVPSPAAGMMTNTFIEGKKYTESLRWPLDHRHDGLRFALVGDRSGFSLLQIGGHPVAAAGIAAIIELAEDHLAGGGLQDRSHRDVDVLADHLASVVHDDHGPVVKICDTLVVLLAFFQDEDLHYLAGQHDGLERIRQLVDIQHVDALELRDFVQVEIVGEDLRALVELGKFDQLQVDFADGGKIVLHYLHSDRGGLLDALQDVEAAASAIPLERITGIGDELQLAQHEMRDDKNAIEEAGVGDVGDAAVDDHAGVEDLVHLLALLLAAEDAAQRGKIEQVAFVGADDQADVGHQHHDQQFEKALRAAGREAVLNNVAEQEGAEDAEDGADDGADEPLQAHHEEAALEQDDGEADSDPGCECRQRLQAEGGEVERRNPHGADENEANDCQIHKRTSYPSRGGTLRQESRGKI